jgi:hypothetical protein
MGTADDGETEGSFLFRFDERSVRGAGGGLRLALDATEFFSVGEDEVHMLGEG